LDGISGLNFATIYAVALEEQGFRRFVESISPVTVLVPTDEVRAAHELVNLKTSLRALVPPSTSHPIEAAAACRNFNLTTLLMPPANLVACLLPGMKGIYSVRY
jgi:hypothetical protein